MSLVIVPGGGGAFIVETPKLFEPSRITICYPTVIVQATHLYILGGFEERSMTYLPVHFQGISYRSKGLLGCEE